MPVSALLTASPGTTRSATAPLPPPLRISARFPARAHPRWSNAMRSRLSNPLCAAVVLLGAVWLQPAPAAVDDGEEPCFLAHLQERPASQPGDADIRGRATEENYRKTDQTDVA